MSNANLIGKQVAHSDDANRRDERQNVQVVDPVPVDLLAYAATRARERPDRCPAPGCKAMEFKPHPDGGWRCLKSAHDPAAYVLAMMGAET